MSEKKDKYTAVVLASGKGTRMGGSVAKQFLEIGGKPVVVYALRKRLWKNMELRKLFPYAQAEGNGMNLSGKHCRR